MLNRFSSLLALAVASASLALLVPFANVPTTLARPAMDVGGIVEPLGGVTLGRISAASSGDDKLDICARGKDNKIYEKYWSAADGWSPWQNLGGTTPYTPSCLQHIGGNLDVYHTGDNAHLYHKWYDGKDWHGWENLGGDLADGPTCTNVGVASVDCFGRWKNDNTLHRKSWDGHKWSDWTNLGGKLDSQPECTSSMTNIVDCFYRSLDGKIMASQINNGVAGPWAALDGDLEVTDTPSAVMIEPAHIELMARGSDAKLHRRCRIGGKWFPWKTVPVDLFAPVGAIQRGTSKKIDYFTVTMAGATEHRTAEPIKD